MTILLAACVIFFAIIVAGQFIDPVIHFGGIIFLIACSFALGRLW